MKNVETIIIPGHKNLYSKKNLNRDLRIDFGIPRRFNQETGLFILSPGFGAHIDSKIYQKLLSQLPDKYNVVTIQCSYFGNEFMQEAKNLNFLNLENIFSAQIIHKYREDYSLFSQDIERNDYFLEANEMLNESIDYFADLSFMQSIDIITSIDAVKLILKENNLMFNENRIVAYGQSQGAYLLLLANRIVPDLFTYIIDNSAWEYPKYLTQPRINIIKYGNSTIKVNFNYLAKNIVDYHSLNLEVLYQDFKNQAYIYSILGSNDNLLDIDKKKEFIKKINNSYLEYIDENKIDGKIYKSANHGLDADFIELIDHAMLKEPRKTKKSLNQKKENYILSLGKYVLSVNYEYGLPIFDLEYKF